LGWLVGFVETDSPKARHVLTFNMSDPRERRIAIVKLLLQAIGVLPRGAASADGRLGGS
jgi:beta-lactamase class D